MTATRKKGKAAARSRTFEYVAFWDQVAWVAGPTSYNSVAQGQTLGDAVDNLREQLRFTALWSQADGREPFADEGLRTTPLEAFTDTRDCYEGGIGVERRDRRYTGEVTVEWREDEPGWEKKEETTGERKDS